MEKEGQDTARQEHEVVVNVTMKKTKIHTNNINNVNCNRVNDSVATNT